MPKEITDFYVNEINGKYNVPSMKPTTSLSTRAPRHGAQRSLEACRELRSRSYQPYICCTFAF